MSPNSNDGDRSTAQPTLSLLSVLLTFLLSDFTLSRSLNTLLFYVSYYMISLVFLNLNLKRLSGSLMPLEHQEHSILRSFHATLLLNIISLQTGIYKLTTTTNSIIELTHTTAVSRVPLPTHSLFIFKSSISIPNARLTRIHSCRPVSFPVSILLQRIYLSTAFTKLLDHSWRLFDSTGLSIFCTFLG